MCVIKRGTNSITITTPTVMICIALPEPVQMWAVSWCIGTKPSLTTLFWFTSRRLSMGYRLDGVSLERSRAHCGAVGLQVEAVEQVEPFYPKGEGGRRLIRIVRTLRLYIMQQSF